MNNLKRKYYDSLILLMLLAIGHCSFGQDASITTFIKEIEAKSTFIINYDRNQTDKHLLNFSFDEDYSLKNVERFFSFSPFDIKVNDFVIMVLPINASRSTLCGTILAMDGTPLAFANIYIDSIHGVESQENGRFELKYRGDLDRECTISYIGYLNKKVPLRDLKRCRNIYLDENRLLFSKSVIIKSYLKKNISEGRSFGSLDINLPSNNNRFFTKDQDIQRSLQSLPGISSADDSATNLNIRGGSADHNNITWENVPLYDRGYLSGMISSVNPFSLKTIQVHKSNTTAEKNSRIGGTVNFQLSDDMIDHTTISAGINLTEGHLNIGTPLIKNKLGLFVAGRKSLFSEFESSSTLSSYAQKIFQSQVVDQDSEDETSEESEPKISYHDINAKLLFDNGQIEAKSAFMVSDGRNENLSLLRSINLSGMDVATTSTFAINNSISYELNQKNELSLSHTYSSFDRENEIEFNNDSTSITIEKEEESNSIIDQQFKLKWNYSTGGLKSSLGYIFDQKSTEIKTEKESSIAPEVEEETEIEGSFHHLFIDQRWSNEQHIFEYGTRATYAVDLSQLVLSPSIAYRYRISPNIILKSSAGIYHQFIRQIYNTIDEGINDDNTVWTLNVSPDEPIMRARKIAVGASWRNASWLVDIEAYSHHTTGLVAENPIIRNTITLNNRNELLSKGIDFILNRKMGSWSTSIFYSLSENSISLSEVFGDGDETFVANNNQTHQLRWNGAYEVNNFSFDLSYQFKSGLPYSGLGQIENSDSDEEKYEVQYENVNNLKLSSYNRLDFSASYNGSWNNYNYQIGCSVLNILNRSNIGSRKSILTNTNDSSATPSIIEIRKNLLPRTFIFHLRTYL